MGRVTSIHITLISAGLYVVGLVFYSSELRALGLDESMFPLTFDRSLFYGFTVLASIGLKSLVYLLLAAELILVFSLLTSYVSKLLRSWFAMRVGHVPGTKIEIQEGSFQEFSLKMLLIVTWVAIFFLCVVVMLSFVEKAGVAAADRLKEKGGLPIQTITFKDGRKSTSGMILVCNQSQCAYLVDKYTKIYNLSEIESLEHRNDTSN